MGVLRADGHRSGLDRLGNWTQGAGQTDGGGAFVYAGRVEESDDDLDGEYESGELVEARAHAADLRNRLEEVETDTGGGPAAEAIVYDLAGNLVADDLYWYQYDAFNRLACVRLKGTLEFDADGFVEDGEPGAWRAHFAYDALGRLISKQVPWGAQGADERWCWYYYDGVRRIVEVFRDPLVTGGGIGGGVPTGNYTTYTDREYVWGPDYVDECLWQIDKIGDAAFVLQDGNYNVVGLVDDEGGLLRQYAWDPYGQAIAVDSLGIFGHNRLGHQGLFFDRLDANAPNADLTATARGVYYARNRNYEPRLGRWMTGDPNGTGLAVLINVNTHDARKIDEIYRFDAQALYGDGLNLYQHVRSNPVLGRDPMGLFLGLGGLFGNLQNFMSRLYHDTRTYQVGQMAAGFVDDIMMGYGAAGTGASYMGPLIGGGTIGGAMLLDDLLGPAAVTLKRIWYGSERTGFGATTQAHRYALEEVASGANLPGTREIIRSLSDKDLQLINPGRWFKGEVKQTLGSGERLIIHFSEHADTGMRWDVKIVNVVSGQ